VKNDTYIIEFEGKTQRVHNVKGKKGNNNNMIKNKNKNKNFPINYGRSSG